MKLRTLKSTIRTAPSPGLRTAPTNTDAWRVGKTTAERGYGARWQRARVWFLHYHPLCVMCQAEDRIELATVVDHKIPHRGDPILFWDRSNWQSLCAPHHSGDKQRMENGKLPAARVGLDGWPQA
jgi:5-methylcytosine-specific restriction protein A